MGASERIIQYLDFKGISKYKFCKELGFSNKFLDNSSNMGTDKACKILHYYPDINSEWLLTGKGEMLRENNNVLREPEVKYIPNRRKTKDRVIDIQEVPIYDLEATAGLVELFNSDKPINTLETIKIPNIPKCDGALPITGDSMYPLLKSGDIILYKQIPIDMSSIFFGEMYLLGIKIDGIEEMVTVKFVQKSDVSNNHIKLVSQNQYHQPKDILLDQVTAMALVKVSIRINTML